MRYQSFVLPRYTFVATLLLILIIIGYGHPAQAQIITSVAGRGYWGFGGDGGPATAAQLNYPTGVATDRNGNVYFSDAENFVVRKISPAGIITTFAGYPFSFGYSGDGGPATLAQLNSPWGLATDGSGNLYIADYGNNRVRRVSPAGIITTVAGSGVAGYAGDGGPATAAQLNEPSGLATDLHGNLYISEEGNNVVRKVSAAGIISTFAGNGGRGFGGDGGPAVLAVLWAPIAVATDGADNVYVSDLANNRVRKIDTAGIITTIAGGGPDSLGDGGPATSARFDQVYALAWFGGCLYVSDPTSETIRRIDKHGIITNYAGNYSCCYNGDGIPATAAEFHWPLGLAADACGNLYIGDAQNNRIRKIIECTLPATTPISGPDTLCAGETATFADTTAAGFWWSSNPAVIVIDSQLGTATAHAPGSCYVTYQMGSCCAVSKYVVVAASPVAGAITSNRVNAFCIGYRFEVNDTPAGGAWRLSNNHISLSGDTLTAVSAGWDTLFYTLTNACGTSTAIDSYYVPPPLPALMGRLSVCVGDTVTLRDSVWGGMWTGGHHIGVYDNMQDSGIVVGLSAGTGTVTYTMDLGCSTTATVTVNPTPVAGPVTGPDPVCVGAQFSLITPGSGGIWGGSGPVALVDSAGRVLTLSIGRDSVYYLVGPDTLGCLGSAYFILTVTDSVFSVAAAVTEPLCFSDLGGIRLTVGTGNGPYKFQWADGDTSDTRTGLDSGMYSVRISQDATGCAEEDTFRINTPVLLQQVAAVTSDRCQSGKGAIALEVYGGAPPYHYMWSNQATVPDISGLSAGTYQCLVTDSNGCTASATYVVSDSGCRQVVIHDGISPNGDGINDVWVIEGIEDYPANTVKVFDKWGDEVFAQVSYKNNWDGRGPDGLLPDGTYYYLVRLNAAQAAGLKQEYAGNLIIKR